MNVQIVDLVVYPVKSLAGVHCEQMSFDALGARYDRRYMLVDENNRFVSQRKCAEMAKAKVEDAGESWKITSPKGDTCMLPKVGEESTAIEVNVWSDDFQAYKQPQSLSDWFSAWMAMPVTLVYIGEALHRPVDHDYVPGDKPRFVGFADGFPLLLTHTASLAEFNSHMPFSIEMKRFRPNIVISGAKAYDEDQWKTLTAASDTGAGQVFLSVKPCSRCAIPTIDPETAKKQPEVWKTLSKTRKGDDGEVYFGHNLLPQNDAEIRIGDTLECGA